MNQPSRYTVQDLLRLALPVGTTVVAGQSGMARRVKWVSVLNTRPPAFPDLAGGELALISLDAMRLLSDKLTLTSLIHDLSEMEVAAIAVAGEIGAPARAAADEHGVPLLRLPDTAPLRAIERQVGQVLIGAPVSPEERGREVREQLLQLSTENRGLRALAAALADLAGKTVVVQDKRLHTLAAAGPLIDSPAWPAIEDALYDANPLPALFRDRIEVAQASPDPVSIALPRMQLRRLVAPIVAGKMGRGFLSLVFQEGDPVDAFDAAFARNGAAVCALEMAKEKAIREAQKRVQGNVLEQFLGGMINENEALLRLTR
ncbi:MAG: PucR family transcriptional regulator ligand-binding domain-containing protein, partial [Anaerolineae bacterium]|nr:PucR family transcriptional regulator ligand-binding domain-containing protein [Anaerolineae bacterium]